MRRQKEKAIFAKLKMLEMGIVPAFTGNELREMMKSLNPAEQRVAKRKFRKAWRKLLKNNPELKECLIPDSGKEPGKKEKRNIAVYVLFDIMEKH